MNVRMGKKKESIRQLRVAHELRSIISEILYKNVPYKDGIGDILITVTSVEVSASLQDAKIFVVPVNKGEKEDAMEYLQNKTRMFRSMVSQKLNLKFAPNLRFIFDESFDYADHINEVLRSISS